MSTTTQHAPGTFCWPELATSDQDGAKKFYSTLFGWSFNDTPMGPNEVYTTLQLGGRAAAALYNMRPEMRAQGIPPHWMSYVAVEDADQTAARASQLGGTIIVMPDGSIPWSHMSKDAADNATIDEIVEAVRSKAA